MSPADPPFEWQELLSPIAAAAAKLGRLGPAPERPGNSIESFLASYISAQPMVDLMPLQQFLSLLADYIENSFADSKDTIIIVRQTLTEAVAPERLHLRDLVEDIISLLETIERHSTHAERSDFEPCIVEKLLTISRSLLGLKLHRESLALAETVTALLDDARDPAHLEALRIMLRAGPGVYEWDDLALHQARYAGAFASAAQHDDALLVTAYNAIESSFRCLPYDPRKRATAARDLAEAIGRHDRFHSLSFYRSLVEQDQSIAEVLHGLASPQDLFILAYVISDADPVLWFEIHRRLVPSIARMETAKNRGIARSGWGAKGQATWEALSFVHPVLAASVPFSGSPLEMNNRDDFLFTVHHEVTHIYSMFSHIGVALSALRIALLNTEFRLWDIALDQGLASHTGDFLQRGVAPLSGCDPMALALAERCLSITQKMRIVQDVWQPWFEGIAIFAELADDPSSEDIFTSEAMGVLINLFDLGSFNKKFDPYAPFGNPADRNEHIAAVGRLYSDTISRASYFRLRTYLTDERAHYLPGYLAVRSVVASWRRTVGEPLNGPTVARILMHLTRFGTQDTLPSFAMSVDEFRKAALAQTEDWLKTIANLDKSDLLEVARPSLEHVDKPKYHKWQDGRLITLPREPDYPWGGVLGFFREKYDEAIAGSIEAHPDLDGTPQRDGRIHEVSVAAAERLKMPSDYDGEFAEKLLRMLMSAFSILPIGEYDCPFWVNEQGPRLYCVFKTHERDQEYYQGVSVELTQAEVDSLVQAVSMRREGRMHAARIADVSSPGVGHGRGFGRQFLVFSYGDWFKVSPCGLDPVEFHTSLMHDVEARLHDKSIAHLERTILVWGDAGARRTREWIADTLDDAPLERASLAPRQWMERVASRADEVLSAAQRPELVNEISQRMLHFVFADATVCEAVAAGGLRSLVQSEAELRDLVRALDATARMPGEDVSVGLAPLMIRHPYGVDVRLPGGAVS